MTTATTSDNPNVGDKIGASEKILSPAEENSVEHPTSINAVNDESATKASREKESGSRTYVKPLGDSTGQFRPRKQSHPVAKRTSMILDAPPVDLCLDQFMDIPMPRSQIRTTIPPSPTKIDEPSEETTGNSEKKPLQADRLYVKSYGRSLMVGYCQSYMSDFVLMGLPSLKFEDQLEADLKECVQECSLSEPVSSSFCILGDFNNMKCKVLGYEGYSMHGPTLSTATTAGVTVKGDHIRNGDMLLINPQMSDYVFHLLHECKNLFTAMSMPAESCLDYLEERLRILYLKAVLYKKLMMSIRASTQDAPSIFQRHSANETAPSDVSSILGLQSSDMALIEAISTTF